MLLVLVLRIQFTHGSIILSKITADVSEDILNSDWDRGLQDGTSLVTELSLPCPVSESWSSRDMHSLLALKPPGTVLSVLLPPFILFILHFLMTSSTHSSSETSRARQCNCPSALGPEISSCYSECTIPLESSAAYPTSYNAGSFFLSLPCSKAFSRVGDVVPLRNVCLCAKSPMFDLQYCLKIGMVNHVCNLSL